MADSNFMFEIDAGKILAKMHRAGCMKHKDFRFFNTGILDDVDVDPDKIDEKSTITFDFSNKDAVYEIGVKLPDFDVPVKATPEDIAKAAEKDLNENAVQDAKDEVDKKSGILDSAETVDSKKADAAEKAAEKTADSEKKPGSGDQPGKKDAGKREDSKNTDGKNLSDEQKKLADANNDAFFKFLDAKKKLAVTYLKDYMTSFGGAQNAAKINENNVVISYLSTESLNPYKIKKYDDWRIEQLSPAEILDGLNKQLENNKLKSFKMTNVCFKTAYSLDIQAEK